MAQFEKASILYTSFKGNAIQITDNISVKEVSVGDTSDGFYNEIAYFTECLEKNTQPEECMPVSSLQAVQLCYKHL
jgi:hypothetical protein